MGRSRLGEAFVLGRYRDDGPGAYAALPSLDIALDVDTIHASQAPRAK